LIVKTEKILPVACAPSAFARPPIWLVSRFVYVECAMKTPAIFVMMDILMVLGYGGALLLNIFRRMFRRTKA
jgi:hypothetical protein